MTAQHKDLCSITRVAQSSSTSWVSQPSPHFSVAWQPFLTGSLYHSPETPSELRQLQHKPAGKKAKAARLLTAWCSWAAPLWSEISRNTHLNPVLLGDTAAHMSAYQFQTNPSERTGFNVEVSYISCRKKIRNCNKQTDFPTHQGNSFLKDYSGTVTNLLPASISLKCALLLCLVLLTFVFCLRVSLCNLLCLL